MSDIEALIGQCMALDRARLRRRLARLRRTGAGADAAAALAADAATAAARRDRRHARVPAVGYPAELPIVDHVEAIRAALDGHRAVVVCGETGSGKSTQLPKICLESGRGRDGLIGHTQPRRVAARAVATRIAAELDSVPGDLVGWKVRFHDEVGPDCLIKVLTDGVLLAETQGDRELLQYDTLIVDEAHERSLNIDFLLGYARGLLDRRDDFRLIVSSATIDAGKFARFLGDVPVIEVSGRGHPIEVRYRPPAGDDAGAASVEHAVDAIGEACAEGRGDVLAFFATEREIREAADLLRRRGPRGVEVLPLYARLPFAEQERIFAPGPARRIVLATNVAETSLTVPRIRYVVDTGLARIGRYRHRSGVQRLPIEPIPRAAAEQRAGRCGRVGPGVCVRLYSEADFDARPAYPEPEVRRTDLAAVLLRMRALGIHDVNAFPFIDAPDRRHVNDGLRLLRELGALDDADRLTRLGRRLARIPLDPRAGRILLAGAEFDCLADALVIVAGLSVADPRERPPGREKVADRLHARYRDERSDFITLLRLWDALHDRARARSRAEFRRWCAKNLIAAARFREWQDVHDQLRALAREVGLRPGARNAAFARVHRALLTGLVRYVGRLGDDRSYAGVREASFRLWPGSVLHGSNARWVVAAELVETGRLYARTVARVRPEWIERVARDQLRRVHFEAHWDARRGEAMVYEQAVLYGLTIIARRRVRFAPVSPAGARELLIRHGLVERQLESGAPFLASNAALVDILRGDEQKLRAPGALVDEDAIADFYDARLPPGVVDAAAFDAWWRGLTAAQSAALCLDVESARRRGVPGPSPADFPDGLHLGGVRLPLGYRFDPGGAADGLSVKVPRGLLRQLDPAPFEWLVPGLLAEKSLVLLRALPKALRRDLAPLADLVDSFLASDPDPTPPLRDALAEHARVARAVDVPGRAWPAEPTLADHLRVYFRVIDEDGSELAAGRDLMSLQRALGAPASPGGTLAAGADGLTDWSIGDLPEVVGSVIAGARVQAYPALVDAGSSVTLRLVESPERAVLLHRAGLRRLCLLATGLQRAVPPIAGLDRLRLMYVTVGPHPFRNEAGEDALPGPGAELEHGLRDVAAERAFLEGAALARTEAQFRGLVERGRGRFEQAFVECAGLAAEVLERYRGLRLRLAEASVPGYAESYGDVHRQLRHLVYREFLGESSPEVLAAMPRYLDAVAMRLDKLERGGARDGDKLALIAPLWDRYESRARNHRERGRRDPELMRYRWMLEEYRVSLFAQELGTAYRVSRERLDRQWTRVAA